MSGWIVAARRIFPTECAADACEDAGCTVSLDGVSQDRILVDLDCEALGLATETHADFILAAGSRTLACVELKSGRTRKAVQQLQATATYMEAKLPIGCRNLEFRAILVHEVDLRANQVRHFARASVSFRGHKYRIERLRCGGRLADALR